MERRGRQTSASRPFMVAKIATGEIEEEVRREIPNRGWQEGRKSPGQGSITRETLGDRQAGSCCEVERRGDSVVSERMQAN